MAVGCLYQFETHTIKVGPFYAGIMFYPQRLDGLITFQSLWMGFWAMTISNHAGHHHPVKEKRYKGWNHLWHSWNGPEAIRGRWCVCEHTVCVYVCINGCFAPLIMPRHQLRPEGMRGRASCDWLMRYAILSDSESPFTAVAYWWLEGYNVQRHLHAKSTRHVFKGAGHAYRQ